MNDDNAAKVFGFDGLERAIMMRPLADVLRAAARMTEATIPPPERIDRGIEKRDLRGAH